jgi:hypothetical protein
MMGKQREQMKIGPSNYTQEGGYDREDFLCLPAWIP